MSCGLMCNKRPHWSVLVIIYITDLLTIIYISYRPPPLSCISHISYTLKNFACKSRPSLNSISFSSKYFTGSLIISLNPPSSSSTTHPRHASRLRISDIVNSYNSAASCIFPPQFCAYFNVPQLLHTASHFPHRSNLPVPV